MKYLVVFIRFFLIGLTMSIYLGTYLASTLVSAHTKERGFRLRRNWARLGSRILGIRNKYDGAPIAAPAIYAVNHRSLVDPMIIAPHIDAFVVAKAEVASYPVLGYGAAVTGIVFVKREDKSSRSATVQAMYDILERGDNVMIFPEGTTNLQRLTKTYKIGSFRVAADLGVPIVPVILEYRDDKDLWHFDHVLPQFAKQFGTWKTHTKMHIGPPFLGSDPQKLMEEVKAYTDETLVSMHDNWTKMQFVPSDDEKEVF